MSGVMVPLVLVPRYTTYAGPADFTTIGVDVTEYSEASIAVWRGNLAGAPGTFALNFQGSLDQKTWGNLLGSDQDPGALTEVLYEFQLKLPYLRMILKLTGTDAVVTAYACGYLRARQH